MEKSGEKQEAPPSNEHERQHLIELGVKLAQNDPKAADEIFKRTHASNQEIQVQFAMQEFKQMQKEQKSREKTEEMRESVEAMYKKIIEEAKRKGDEEKVRVYETALKTLKKEQENKH